MFEEIKKLLEDPLLGEMVSNHRDPIVTFDGGDVYDGWIHEIFRFPDDHRITYEKWESGGYSNGTDIQEHESDQKTLLSFLSLGVPLPRWSNAEGIRQLLEIGWNNSPVPLTAKDTKKRIIDAYKKLPTCRYLGIPVAQQCEDHKILSPLAFLRACFGLNRVPGPPPDDSCDPEYTVAIDGEEYTLSNPTQEVYAGWIS